MLHLVKTFHFNGSVFDLYRCDEVGDELPLHSHNFNHLTVVVGAGEIEVFTEQGVVTKGQVGDAPFEYKAGRQHGIRALTDGVMFMNISPSHISVSS